MKRKIDSSNWQEFPINKIFDAENTGNVLAREIEDGSGTVPFVTASGINNGVVAHIDPRDYKILRGNCILVGGKTFTLTYQEKNFVSNDSHNFVLRAKDSEVGKKQYLFMLSVIRATYEQKYSWNDAVTKNKMLKEFIKLPIREPDCPDWEYMEIYITKINQNVKEKLEKLNSVDSTLKTINISNWKRFHLYDLFYIDMGTKLDRVKMEDDNPIVDFVGRANTNNGVTTQINRIENLEPYKKGYMTLALGGEYLGSCFIQKNSFYTSQNVIVLIPKKDMSDNIKLFIATCIFKESRLHYKAFKDELNRHIKKDFSFPLPVDEKFNPNYEYMENYILKIRENEQKNKKYELV